MGSVRQRISIADDPQTGPDAPQADLHVAGQVAIGRLIVPQLAIAPAVLVVLCGGDDDLLAGQNGDDMLAQLLHRAKVSPGKAPLLELVHGPPAVLARPAEIPGPADTGRGG